MSAADCRAGKCSCAAKSATLTVVDRTVTQRITFGWRNPTGEYDWRPADSELVQQVSPVWAKHIEARSSKPDALIEQSGGWLIYRTHPYVPDIAGTAVARIRWEPAEAVSRG